MQLLLATRKRSRQISLPPRGSGTAVRVIMRIGVRYNARDSGGRSLRDYDALICFASTRVLPQSHRDSSLPEEVLFTSFIRYPSFLLSLHQQQLLLNHVAIARFSFYRKRAPISRCPSLFTSLNVDISQLQLRLRAQH